MFQLFWSAPTLEAFKKNLAPHLADLLGLYSCLEQEALEIAGCKAVLEEGLDVFWEYLLDEYQGVLYRYLIEQGYYIKTDQF